MHSMDFPSHPNAFHPNRENIFNDANTLLPIETAYFLESAEQDKVKFNQYYFNYPPEWSTANKGESIIVIRSPQMIRRRLQLEFDAFIFKLEKTAFVKHGGKLDDPILTDELLNKFIQDDTKEEYKNDPKWRHDAHFTVIDWISAEGDFRGFFDAVNTAMKSWKAINGDAADVFSQDDSFIADRDIQTDGYYDKDVFHEIIYTVRNDHLNDDNQKFINFYKIENWNEDFADVFKMPPKSIKYGVKNWYSIMFGTGTHANFILQLVNSHYIII